jgi:hypothetical protein
MSIDANGLSTITDLSANMTVTASGISYIIFSGGAVSNSAFSQAYYRESGQNVQLAAFYQAVLGRQPDLPGLEFWQTHLTHGDLSMQQIAGDFLNSPEFLARFPTVGTSTDRGGTNDSAFVTQLYQNILGRGPDAAGLAFWLGTLSSGANLRSDVVTGFTSSFENLSSIVASATNPNGWLVDLSHGGYADATQHLPAQTILSQAAITGYIDTSLAQPVTSVVRVTNGTATVGMSPTKSYVTTIFTSAEGPNLTIALSGVSQYGYVKGDHDTIIAPPHGTGILYVDDPSTNAELILQGGNNNIQMRANAGASVIGFSATDSMDFADAPGTGIVAFPTQASPDTYSPTVRPQYTHIDFVGSIGNGTLPEIAAAANKVYKVTDLPGEYSAIFFGQTNNGNTVVVIWSTDWVNGHGTNNDIADSQHTMLVQPYDLRDPITLVGVQATNLTSANFQLGPSK